VGLLADGGGGGSGGGGIFENAEHPHQEGQLVDWATLQILERQDEEEGRLELIDEDQVYVLLGLRDEDDKAEQAAKEATTTAGADDDNEKAHAVEDTLSVYVRSELNKYCLCNSMTICTCTVYVIQ